MFESGRVKIKRFKKILKGRPSGLIAITHTQYACVPCALWQKARQTQSKFERTKKEEIRTRKQTLSGTTRTSCKEIDQMSVEDTHRT